jgi:hypothetical protein
MRSTHIHDTCDARSMGAGDAWRWAAFEFMLKKPIIQGVVGGVLVMAAAAMGFVLGGGRHFMWVMAWPALLLRPLFPPPAPDQIFPVLGSCSGIICTLVFATAVYSLTVCLVIWCRSRFMRLP